MYNRISHILLLTILLFVIGVPVASATPDNGELVFFMPDTDWPPYTTSQTPGEPRGVLIETLEEAVRPLGYTLIIRTLPDRRGWVQLENGDVDAHAKAKEWVDDPDRFLWTVPFLESQDTLITAAKDAFDYDSPADLKGMRIAVIGSFAYPALEPYFADGSITRINTSDPYRMLDLVEKGRADAAVVNKHETQWLFKTRQDLSANRFTIHEKPIDSAWYRFAFTRANGWQPHIKRLNMELEAMIQDGRLDAILQRYK